MNLGDRRVGGVSGSWEREESFPEVTSDQNGEC